MMHSQHDPMMDLKSTTAKTDSAPVMPMGEGKDCCAMAEHHDGTENMGTMTMSKDCPPAPASPGPNGKRPFGAPTNHGGM